MAISLSLTVAIILLHEPSACGQAEKPKLRWEYRVLLSATAHKKEGAVAMTQEFNALAADGWEYVGPVSESAENGPYLMRPGIFVLFKRPK